MTTCRLCNWADAYEDLGHVAICVDGKMERVGEVIVATYRLRGWADKHDECGHYTIERDGKQLSDEEIVDELNRTGLSPA